MWRCVGTFSYVTLQLTASSCNLTIHSKVSCSAGRHAHCDSPQSGNFQAGCLRIVTVMTLYHQGVSAWSMVWFRWGCTASCGWNVRCVGVRGDAWSVMLSPCNTLSPCYEYKHAHLYMALLTGPWPDTPRNDCGNVSPCNTAVTCWHSYVHEQY